MSKDMPDYDIFKETALKVIVPGLEQRAEREKEHFLWLVGHGGKPDVLAASIDRFIAVRTQIKEYKEYFKN
jgi:hypothetical protein